ncbi:MAG: biliverdin-producing heme oxygenase [Hyphomicrobiaceae bacterium]
MGGLLRRSDDGYQQFLAATARALLPLEHALCENGVSDILSDWPDRSRSDALRADLSALSVAEPDTNGTYENPNLRDEAYMLGAIYVLEGSRLGARLLVDTVRNAHPHALRYLCHGNALPLWPTFLAQLGASSKARRNPERAEAGAAAAFRLFLPHSNWGVEQHGAGSSLSQGS